MKAPATLLRSPGRGAASRRFLVEWLLMAVLLPPLLVWLHHQPGAVQANLALYDRLLALRTPAPGTDLLIIGIDARSLREIGPWPWPRAVHAQLLDRLAPLAPRSVLLDLFLDTPSADDASLAQAMRALPVHLPQRLEDADPVRPDAPALLIPPVPLLAAQAHGTGHASVTADGDGIVRWLRTHEGRAGQPQPYIGLALAGQAAAHSPGTVVGIPLAGPAGSYRTVPYASVLRGEVPPELLRGRDLLVGAVQDAGLGDNVPVSLGGRPAFLPGVELHANAIDALRARRAIVQPAPWAVALWIALPVWLSLLLFLRLARHAALAAGVLALLWLGASAGMLAFAQRWLPPFMPIVGIALAYFLWSWRRLHALLGLLGQRIDALNAVPSGAFEASLLHPAGPRAIDAVDRQTDALDRAVQRLAQLQALLGEGLWRMPAAVLLCGDDGRILQSNAEARRLLRPARTPAPPQPTLLAQDEPLSHANLLRLLDALSHTAAGGDAPPSTDPWLQAARREYTTAQGRVLRLQSAAIQSGAPAVPTVRVVQLQDLTAERHAQRERARWLGFLSHDLRSPQVTILNLLTLHAERGGPLPGPGIRREAERTLALAERFIDLIQAESADYRLDDIEAAAVVLDAVEQAAPIAQLRGVRLHLEDAGDTPALIHADGSLLQRALYNLISNALRHSPAGGEVRVCLAIHVPQDEAQRSEIVIAVNDRGEGMPPERLAQLLAPQQDAAAGAASDDPGSPARRRGIGFAVAQAVVRRHGGWLDAHSAPGQGSTFLLGLPARPIEHAP